MIKISNNICSDYASMVRGAFRQARELADGQKSADVKHNWALPPPPPPTQIIGGEGRNSREIARFFAFRAIIWRRGGKSPRKMQVYWLHHSSFGAGRFDRVILSHAEIGLVFWNVGALVAFELRLERKIHYAWRDSNPQPTAP